MKNWTKESLYDFRFLSGLRLSTEADVYRVARLDEKENRYISDLWARVDGREFLLASDVGGFLRIEDDRVLFSAHEKASEEPQGKLESKIYTIDVRGGERSLLRTLPFAVSDVRVIDDEWLLVLGEYEDKFSELTGEEKRRPSRTIVTMKCSTRFRIGKTGSALRIRSARVFISTIRGQRRMCA